MENKDRLMSLDTLRGLDMMFILGLAAIISKICGLFPGGEDSWLADQMRHVDLSRGILSLLSDVLRKMRLCDWE